MAVWYGDDLAYADSTMVSPRVYRQYLFPWMEELAAIAHAAGLPFIFHSDGKVWDVIPDLIAVGVNALHPIEPKAMDINLVKARYGDKLALIGNIDMDLLSPRHAGAGAGAGPSAHQGLGARRRIRGRRQPGHLLLRPPRKLRRHASGRFRFW